ncbi:site-specific integrase [Actinokineospora spheciospongiae]|uniref:hypothetical protein n=1 Tax=Actinokineospora spheciospongiae TaxID=909613 RepID=UPI000D71B934|nr:hypothetical protein [Actinokineospora spheciospongiae]PWW65855.1 hypothetical protein DFQ13_102613 [Actinokineospora spheciospongiae]
MLSRILTGRRPPTLVMVASMVGWCWTEPGSRRDALLNLASRDRTVAWRPVCNQWTWAPALKKAGITPASRVNGFHALLHFYVSTLLDAGETTAALSAYLGHTDPGFTLKDLHAPDAVE